MANKERGIIKVKTESGKEVTVQQMKTAEEILNKTIEDYNKNVSQVYAFQFSRLEEKLFSNMMIEFAKMHVTEALKQASEKAELSDDSNCYAEAGYCSKTRPCNQSILNAYPLDQIK